MKANLVLNKITTALFLGSVLSSALVGPLAIAQQTSNDIDTAPSTEQVDEDDFEQIIVTANRTSSVAEKTPIALSVLGTNQLRDQGITNPTQQADSVPNVSIDRTNGLQIAIRGVSSTDNTEKSDPSAAFMLDGVYIARPQAKEISFFDIARVEVLRGPQGTLYGRNTTAGLINVISAKPHEFFEASIDGSIRNYNARQFTGMVNLPASDKAMFRVADNIDQRDNFIDYEPLEGTEVVDISDYKDNRSVRLSGLFKTSESTELLVSADYSDIQGNGMSVVPVRNFYETPFTNPANVATREGTNPTYIDLGTDEQTTLRAGSLPDEVTNNSTWGLMTDFNWFINDEYSFNYLGSYREFTRDELNATLLGGTETTDSWERGQFVGDYEQQSHEFRLAYDNGVLQAQAGLYYFNEKSGIRFDMIGLINPTPGEDGYVFGFPQDPTKSESLGFFGQATYAITDDLRLTVGIRTTRDEKSRFGATVFQRNEGEELNFEASDDNPLPDSLNFADRAYSKTTWKLGFDYDWDDLTMVYGSIATGYKAGGFNDGCIEGAEGCNSPLPEAAVYYAPETLTSTELGIKTRILDRTMTLNANVFMYDYEDLQLSQVSYICGGPCQVTTNAAEATVNGAEFDVYFRPNAEHQVTAAATWLDASYDEWIIDEEFQVDFGGEPLSRSPEWTANLGYQYSLGLASGDEVVFAINSRWSDEFYINDSRLRASFRQPSFTKTDVTVTYNHESMA